MDPQQKAKPQALPPDVPAWMEGPAQPSQTASWLLGDDHQLLAAPPGMRDRSGAPGIDPVGVLIDWAKKGGNWIKQHPGQAGALAATLPLSFLTMEPGPTLLATAGLGTTGAGTMLAVDKMMGGEATRDKSVPDLVVDAIQQGGLQTLGAGTGMALKGGARMGANQLMNSAAGAQTALRRDFTGINLGDVLNRRGINPTSARGAAKAGRLLGEATAARNGLNAAADAGGAIPIDASLRSPEMQQAMQKIMAHAERMVRAGRPDPMPEIIDRWTALAQANPQGITMQRASDILNELSDEGSAAYSAFKAGQAPHDIAAETAAGLANGIRGVQRRQVPGIEQANRDVQELIEALRAAKSESVKPWSLGGRESRYAAMGLGGLTGAATRDPWEGFAAFALPLLIGSPKVAAPLSILGYKAAGALPTLGRVAASAVPTRRDPE